MSHMIQINVKVTNLDSLEKAANTLGFKKSKELTKEGTKFEALFIKGSAYFGVSKGKDGFSFKTDTYYFKGMDQLKQEYAKEETLLLAHQKGLSVKSCKKLDSGEYQIELLKS